MVGVANLEGARVVAGGEGHTEVHEGLETDGAMATRQTVQSAAELALSDGGG